jgi:hypothetical protein
MHRVGESEDETVLSSDIAKYFARVLGADQLPFKCCEMSGVSVPVDVAPIDRKDAAWRVKDE